MYGGEHTAGWTTAILSTCRTGLALAGTIVPSSVVFMGGLVIQQSKWIMAVFMVLWLLSAPFWINKKSVEELEVPE